MHPTDLPAACENCQAPLHGRYCHACGQSAINPLRHAGHALEEFFESFWHLDGRAFRTLRDLLHPGRVALAYLKGHRARYLPPLRVFLVLSVLAFFVARLLVDDAPPAPGERPAVVVNDGGGGYAKARTPAEVDAVLRDELAQIERARRETASVPLMARALRSAESETRAAAQRRLAELRAAPPAAAGVPHGAARPADASPARSPGASSNASPDAAGRQAGREAARAASNTVHISGNSDWGASVKDINREFGLGRLRHPARDWDEQDNPLTVDGWPAFANAWLNHKFALAGRNAKRFEDEPGFFATHALGAVPTALFVLVPLFALLLKLLYLRSGRGYLEHLVVGLYSHAFLLLALLVTFVLVGLKHWLGEWLVLPIIAVSVYMPTYLLLMQKRVYGQGWLLTAAKYAVLGSVYVFLLVGVLLYAVFSTLVAG